MPNQQDYIDGVMVNPYFMSKVERTIYYAGYRDGRRSFAHELKWITDNPDKDFREGKTSEYLKQSGPSVAELMREYNIH